VVKTHGRSRRTATGGLVKVARQKRKYEMGRPPIETKLGNEKKKIVRTKGGGSKIKLFSIEHVNVVNPKTHKVEKVPIKDVVENQCSVDYSRRSIITKGAILETEIGYVKVTSRPGQDGILNAVLTDYQPKK